MPRNKAQTVESVRSKLRLAAVESNLNHQEIGERMGLTARDARKTVWRLLTPTMHHDPRLSTLLKFAKAIGKPLKDLL